jgi:GNAT superfamily N-acetyltransferase
MLEENAQDEVFLVERIMPDRLRAAYEGGRAVIVETASQITAIGALWETGEPGWLELGSLWVAPEYRGKGVASEIYRRRLLLVPTGSHCFVVTHNPRVIKLALVHGFAEATRATWFQLAPYSVVCGPCDREVEDKMTCPLRALPFKCRLLVK